MSSGVQCFFDGFSLINKKGIRRFVYIPILINLVLFGLTFWWLLGQTDLISQWVIGWVPDWLSWLTVLILPVMIVGFFVLFIFLFTSISNFIAAPFHGLLASKVEMMLSPQLAQQADSEFKLTQEIGRTLKREWQKLAYYLPRALGYFILFLFLPVGGQIIWFLFIAWMMAIQYLDFPFDNHQVSFSQMRDQLWRKKSSSFSFGIIVSLFSMIPIINLIVMPVAVCGATKLWVEKMHQGIK
ncbi:sulfate transporter CysZ [Catenovulum sp. 2E275]|uniref:sulfate transporter CysZ n=1 Tax=Catenovulum sp. 2E275 TaxID=2980497 RepID=UPI0021D37371|nr:sulfate transporter CysZ [Catenovulum sp. 2E275]MCU4676143.1 sulfate transporter CysZ [Catenovulum sp. 2E275]